MVNFTEEFLAKTLNTPCFLLDEHEMELEIIEFKKALSRKFKESIIGYSVKTNSLPYALSKAKDYGCFAEVVSDDELQLALECGYDFESIVFNGPMKTKDWFLKAIIGGAKVNIETHRELEWLKELPSDKTFNVGLRLSINISDNSSQDTDRDNDYSRFGFNDFTDEFKNALETIKCISQVRLSGLHIHRTSHTRSVDFYHNSITYAINIINKYNIKLDYLDIGGGFWGIFPGKPTYDEYVKAFYDILSKAGLNNLCIIVEPGSAILAPSFRYFTSVIDVKKLPNCRILTTDGSRTNIDPLYHKTEYLIKVIRNSNDSKRNIINKQIIAGATCLEFDKILILENQEEIIEGDVIIYDKVGAYTMTLSPMFINYLPRVYAIGKEGIKLVREKWTALEHIQKTCSSLLFTNNS